MTRRQLVGLLVALIRVWVWLRDPHPEIVTKQPDPWRPPHVDASLEVEFRIPLP